MFERHLHRGSKSALINICFFSLILIMFSCSPGQNEKKEYARGTKEGYELAKINCSRCHSFVSADHLDRKTWNNWVLPNMAQRLGIGIFGEREYINDPDNKSSLISYDEWVKIYDYYTKTAPLALPTTHPLPAIENTWSIFKLHTPYKKQLFPARTVLTAFDSATNNIYTSDGNNFWLYKWNNRLEIIDSMQLPSPVVSARFFTAENKRKGVFTLHGGMQTTNDALGEIVEFNLEEKLLNYDTLVRHLPRPVQSLPADFDKDGLTDWLVCAFGHENGGLYWLQQMPGNKFNKRPILEVPGAISAVIDDFNNDGWMDIMVLFAHGDECIRQFINNKNGTFTATKIMSFPAVNGSTNFQLIDFNKDGLKDIIYVCGDNGDMSKILKPYHGIYIYLNKGNNKYEQEWFYPVNGCTKAIAFDFDNDGDLDIVSIAFFADFRNRPEEKFIYFEQRAPFQFAPQSPPIEKYGRWISMEMADYDKDGDQDIILGNFSTNFIIDKDFTPNWNRYMPFIVLENKTH